MQKLAQSRYLVLQREDHGFVDVELHGDFRFAGADVAVSAGWVQDTWDQQLLPEVGTLVQEDLQRRKDQREGSQMAEHSQGAQEQPGNPQSDALFMMMAKI